MPVQQNLDLLTRLAYLQAGGRDQGQRDIDKINQTFGGVNQISKTIMDYVAANEALKKNALERKKLEQETTPVSSYGYGDTPFQTKQRLEKVYEQPIPVSELISGKLETRQKGIDEAAQQARVGQAPVGLAKDVAMTDYYTPKTRLAELQAGKLESKQAKLLTPPALRLYVAGGGTPLDLLEPTQIDNYEKLGRMSEAKRIGNNYRVTSLNQPVPREITNALYDKLGLPYPDKTLTVGQFNSAAKLYGYDSNAFWKEIGVTATTGKNLLGEVEPEIKEEIKGKIESRKIAETPKQKVPIQTIPSQVNTPITDIKDKARQFLQVNGQPITEANIQHAINSGWVK
jgi:hypothetical protein